MLSIFSSSKNTAMLSGVAYAPQDGEVMPIAEMPDEIFAEKVLGDGICILPEKNRVYSPVNGIVESVVDTSHALCIIADDGAEIMIHVGVDTVEMKGVGFRMKVKPGQHIKVGQELLEANLSQIKEAGHPIHTAMVISNGNDYQITKIFVGRVTARKEQAFTYTKK